PARVDARGDLISLFEQDRSHWDTQLIAEGLALLKLSATGSEFTRYHIEAAIASIHALAIDAEHTDWAAIVSLYEKLLVIHPSPIVALNRAIAVGMEDGP